MSYVKKYDIGNIRLDSPYSHFIYELPLLSFGDFKRKIDLSLVFQSKTTANPFYISQGYKFNLQKRLILNSNGTPESLEEGNGTLLSLNDFGDRFMFNDESQRVLRKFGDGTYMLENPDMSVERFDINGRIKSVTDKYGETYLTYTYSSGKLDTITYLDDKLLKFTYSSGIGMVEQVQYICANETICSISFVYPGAANVTITHYSGVTYYITYSNSNFLAYSADTGSSYSNDYSHKLTCSIGTTDNNERVISAVKEIGTKEVDRATYTFIDQFDTYKFHAVNVTDINGVVTRVQYENDKPCYSYEVMGDEGPWYDDIFFDDSEEENIYKGVVTINKDDISGQQTLSDGIRMEYLGQSSNYWRTIFSSDESIYGNFQVSGWIEPINTTTCTITVKDAFYSKKYLDKTITNLIPNMWNYFTFRCYMSNPREVLVLLNCNVDSIIPRDFRLTFEGGKVYSSTEITHYTAKQDVVVIEGATEEDVILKIDDNLFFYSGDTNISKTITAKDILRYKTNQKYGSYKNEIYYDDGKGIISGAGTFKVGYYTDDDNEEITTVNVENIAVGQLSQSKNKTYLTKNNFYTDSSGDEHFVSKTLNGTTEIQSVIYDDNLDPTSVTKAGVTTEYKKTNGLLTYENITGLYTRTVTYGEDESGNPTIRTTDEFNNSTTYTLDPVWGAVVSVTLPDGTVIDDTYDGDKSTITEREFGRGTDNITYFNYSGGNLSGLNKGDLSYEFTYSSGSLSLVKKNGSAIEEHILSDDDKTLSNFYPDEDNALYNVEQNVDNYGRPLSVTGLLANAYSINPYYSSSGTYESVDVDCGTSHLATSTDMTTGNMTKFAYEKGRVSRSGVFNSTGTKINEEIFEYDNIGRVTKDDFDYNLSTGNSVTSDITYVTTTDDPFVDNRISICSYKVNDIEKAKTQNRYNDSYKRLTAKLVTIGSTTYDKGFTYNKTRISRVMDVKNGSTFHNVSYDYDSMGRIISEADSVDANINNTYTYDSFGQLIRENNKALDKTYIYSYNEIGNVASVKAYPYTTADTPSGSPSSTSFTYGDSTHPDRLTRYGYNNISYNSIGYPVSYGDKKFVWTKGKLIRLYDDIDDSSSSSSEDVRFTYDAYGRRLTKTYTYDPGDDYSGNFLIGSTTTYNYDHSGRLISESCTEEYTESASTTYEFVYLYDESSVIGFLYGTNGGTLTPYYYHRNLQGDVISIYTTAGTRCVEYTYDAYGNCKTIYSSNTVLADNNPIRYRGYYYDRETKFYYLNARYYNPEWRRFISPDSTEYLDPENPNGLNLYAYCYNDPVNYYDPSGRLAFWIVTAIIGAVIGLGITAAVDFIPDQEFNLHWGYYVGAGVLGAVVGAGIGMAVSYYATGSAFSSVGNVFSGLFGKTTYYRTMTADDYATFQSTGKLPAGKETFITPDLNYARGYDGITVKFTVRNRTVNWLTKIGVKDGSTLVGSIYPTMPSVSKGWMATNAFFKAEQGIINIGLGYGKALNIFNKGILVFGLI